MGEACPNLTCIGLTSQDTCFSVVQSFESYVLSGCIKRSATFTVFCKVPPGVVKRIPHATVAKAAVVPFTPTLLVGPSAS